MVNWFRLRKLEKKLDKIEKKHKTFQKSDKYKKMNSKQKLEEKSVYFDMEYFPIAEEIETIRARIFLRKVRKFGIPYPQYYEGKGADFWQEGPDGNRTLTIEGYYSLRKALREEQEERRKAILCWMPLITALTGLIGAATAILTIVRYWGK